MGKRKNPVSMSLGAFLFDPLFHTGENRDKPCGEKIRHPAGLPGIRCIRYMAENTFQCL